MTIKTTAETVFEEFCNSNNIPWERIPESASPAPDYKAYLNGELVFIEVKQIDKDDDFNGETGVSSRTVGSHVRRKVEEARKQLQAVSSHDAPAVLFIYNNLDPLQMFGTEPHDFIAAMYGEMTVVLNKKENRITDSYYGRNRSFREDKNTSFSAVGCLYQSKEGPTVRIYENVFAKSQINFSSLPDCIEVTRVDLA